MTDVLVFCCGAERIPPLGFGKDPKIVFLYKEDGKLATASTCDIILCLQTLHGDDYQSFKEAMVIMSLKGNDGFVGFRTDRASQLLIDSLAIILLLSTSMFNVTIMG